MDNVSVEDGIVLDLETTEEVPAQTEESVDAEDIAPEQMEEVEWDFLNVNTFQLKGHKFDPERNGEVRCPLTDPACKPFTNPVNGNEFYSLEMNVGAKFKNAEGQEIDLTGYTMPISAKCVHESQYKGKTGVSLPKDADLGFTKSQKIQGQWKEVDCQHVTLPQAQEAQHESVMSFKRYAEAHPERVAQKKEKKMSPSELAADGMARAKTQNAERKAPNQTQGKSQKRA